MQFDESKRLWRMALLLSRITLGVICAPVVGLAQLASAPPPSAWTVLGDGASVEVTRDADRSRDGQPAVDYRYVVGKGQLSVLVLPTPGGLPAQAGGLAFDARADHMTNLTLSLEEQGGGRWTVPVILNADAWRKVDIAFGDLVLSTGGDAPADGNGKLDLQRVKSITVVDTDAMLASKSSDMMRFFGIAEGPRRLALAKLSFTAARTGNAAPSLDGFEQTNLPWSVFGATHAGAGHSAPLQSAGLVVDYRRKTGLLLSLVRPLPPGILGDTSAVQWTLASRLKTKLVVKIEQSDGGTFEAGFELPGDSKLHTLSLPIAEFKRADDSRTRATSPRPDKATNLLLLDIGGLFTANGDNRLWLQSVRAGDAGGAAARAGPAAGQIATSSVAVPGWSSWTKRLDPVYSGRYSLVGDPSVMHDGDIYRMFYNCYDPKRKGGAVCEATSKDGFDWHNVATDMSPPGRVIMTRPGQWDDTHETPLAIKYRGEYLLYFSGYRNKGGFFKSFPAYLGLAVSRDGVHFERVGDEPIMKGTPGGYDSDAVFSPSIVEYDGKLVMLYTGYCFDTCKKEPGVYLMAATSTDGRNWVKREQPVLSKADFPQTKDGAAEADIVKGPDGDYYLFMSLLFAKGHDIGVARASSPFGPWQIAPEPIVRGTPGHFDDKGPIAPSVIIEDGKVRMWYHGFSKRNTIEIGYAQAPWPMKLN